MSKRLALLLLLLVISIASSPGCSEDAEPAVEGTRQPISAEDIKTTTKETPAP